MRRRRFLGAAIGTFSTATIAGCSRDDDGDGGGGGGDGGGGVYAIDGGGPSMAADPTVGADNRPDDPTATGADGTDR